MKFENNRFRIIIEKKKLSPEQEEVCRQRRKKNFARMTAILLVAICIILLVICGKIWGVRQSTEEAYEDALKLASGIQEKYEQKGLYPYTYGEPIEDLGRSENIELRLEYDAMSLENVDYWYEAYGIYQDPELTQRVRQTEYIWDEETRILTITPPVGAINVIGTEVSGAEDYIVCEAFYSEEKGYTLNLHALGSVKMSGKMKVRSIYIKTDMNRIRWWCEKVNWESRESV